MDKKVVSLAYPTLSRTSQIVFLVAPHYVRIVLLYRCCTLTFRYLTGNPRPAILLSLGSGGSGVPVDAADTARWLCADKDTSQWWCGGYGSALMGSFPQCRQNIEGRCTPR